MKNKPADFEPAEQPTAVRFLVLVGLCLAALIAYLCRNSIGVAESTIRDELNVSLDEMGWVMSCFFLTYALGQIPTGALADRLGGRYAIPLFAAAWSLATGLLGFASGVPHLLIARLGNGLAQAGIFPASTAAIGKWFPSTRRAVASGSLASSMAVGGAAAVFITGLLIERIGWRPMFGLYGLVGIVFSVIFFVWYRNTPKEHSWTNQAEQHLIAQNQEQHKPAAKADWLRIYFSPPTWWICGQQFCRAAGQIFFASWFATYLQETRGVTVSQSGLLNSLPLIGIVVGALVGGAVSDFVLVKSGSRWFARCGLASLSMLLCSLFVAGAYFITSPVLAVAAISLGTFCAAVGGPCAYTVTIDMGGRQTAILFGTMNMVGNLGAFAFIRLVPRIIEWANWDAVLALFGILYLGACVFWLLVNPNGTVVDQSLLRSRQDG